MGPVDGQLDGRLAGVDLGASSLAHAVCAVHTHSVAGQSLKLWVLRRGDAAVAEVGRSVLDRGERRRAALLRAPVDRDQFVLAHVALREVLGQYLGVAPADVCYVRETCPRCGGPTGRPALPISERPVHFSLSTTRALVLVGVATTPVGVDVEAPPGASTVAEAAPLLHPAERAEIDAVASRARQTAFMRAWTRKEAYLKAVGVGIAHGLSAEYLGSGLRVHAPSGWTVLDVPVPAPGAAAAALRTPPHARHDHGVPPTPLSTSARSRGAPVVAPAP